MTRDDPLLQAAMDWLLKREAAPADASLRAELEAWRAADPRHAAALARAERAWRLLGEVPPAHAGRWEAATVHPRRATGRVLPTRRRALRAAAVLGLAASLALVLAPEPLLREPLRRLAAEHATGTGELRRVLLADGSAVHLAPRSAIATHFTLTERRVTLLQGEAFFEVARDPARPFLVEAAGAELRVLGTAFDVNLLDDRLELAVQHGQVRLTDPAQAPPLTAELGAGERISLSRAGAAPRRDRLAPAVVAAWRDGPVFVQDATVAEVVALLGRYHHALFLLRDPELAGRRVTGLYDLRDAGRALRALLQPLGGRVRQLTPFLYWMTKS
ncbi:FecR domain-containing protein [Roseomonas sp. 18066]|uniref:FecR family protein n=1 Tax=Roseomonas sp. 18066 TaxID=2681412 RepID=UPI00135C0005|nr:FecR domain-containing protein [Roseomonas sp. 18066]